MKTNQLPPLPTPKFTETIRGVPCITVTEHEHLIRAYALQAIAQVQGEPATVAVDHFDNGPFEAYTNRIYPHVEIGTKLYTASQLVQATQAEVTDDIRPEDFTVDVVVKPMGGFAPVNTQGVRVTHKPTGISVTCDAARSQHTNRHQAFEKLSAILATPTAQAHPAEVTDEQIKEAAVKAVKDGKLSWLGFEKDDQDKYTIPVISKSHYQFARAILALRPEGVMMTDEVEKCAVVAWAHFMDTCRKKRVSPADWGDWCSANAIRKSHHGITAKEGTNGEIN